MELDYAHIIKMEFERRRQKESFYSLRTFAQDLELQPSHLSDLFKGKKGLSKKSAAKIAAKIGLKNFAATKFCFLVSAQSGRSTRERNLARSGLQKKFIKNAKLN
jgi:AraC-like DNA-binding protein